MKLTATNASTDQGLQVLNHLLVPDAPALPGILGFTDSAGRFGASPVSIRILTEPCVVVWFNHGDPVEAVGNGGQRRLGSHVRGIQSRVVDLKPGRHLGSNAVKLAPQAFEQVFGVPAAEVTDRLVPLADLVGATEVAAIEDQLRALDAATRRTALVETFLVRQSRRARRLRDDRAVSRSLDVVLAGTGPSTVEGLSDAIGLGRRQLERRFAARTGLTPKSYLRIARIRDALRAWHAGQPWAEVALEAGYADQSHFVRDFKSFIGMAPASFARNSASPTFRQINDGLGESAFVNCLVVPA
ncbi:helix-turn-helix domain-containing protein [Rubrivivax sp. RP6-9]|uniref:helix-turn-helix domain-containing protein n=1 Tax=Rubrivivax sp. RP6-9 TaxID=3415750 RepID=UPI003CC5D885